MNKKFINSPVPDKIYKSDIYKLVKNLDRIRIVNNKIYILKETGIWQAVSDLEAKITIRSFFCDPEWQDYLSSTIMNGIIKDLQTDPTLQLDASELYHPNLIRVKNGLIDVATGNNLPMNNNLLFSKEIDSNVWLDKGEESKIFQEFCAKVFDGHFVEKKKQALYEIIGFCLSDIPDVKKAVFMIGPANCGKSLILKFIQRLLGDQNVSNVSFSHFSKQFSLAQMQGKSLNISGEVPSSAMDGRALDVFKSITGGDKLELERKGSQPFSAQLRIKLLFAGNTLPLFDKVDGTDALVERLHILVFDKEVEEKERDLELLEKMYEDRDRIVTYAMSALSDFVARDNRFLLMDDAQEILDSLACVSNPIAYFIKDRMEVGKNYAIYITDAYNEYLKYAEEEGIGNIDRKTFRNLMVGQKGVRIAPGKRRLNGAAPKSCFEGIKLKQKTKKEYDDWQDTDMSYIFNDNSEE